MRLAPSRGAAKTILLVCPTMWDEAELPPIVAAGAYRAQMHGTDVSEHPEDFDALDFIDRAVQEFAGRPIDGVMASDDYPGSIVAEAIADQLGLPGPALATVLLCQHKYYSRLAQRAAVPEAVPAFCLIDDEALSPQTSALRFPLFAKPIKSFFSLFAQRVDNLAELTALARRADHHLRARRLSAQSVRNIHQNLGFAFIYEARHPGRGWRLVPRVRPAAQPAHRRDGDEPVFGVGDQQCATLAIRETLTHRLMRINTHKTGLR